MPRNRRPELSGILVIDKPMGWSSAKAVAVVRRRAGGPKVGHAGTLDPLATGVLVLALGRATKAIPALMAGEKVYKAEVDLRRVSETDDEEGPVQDFPLPPHFVPPGEGDVRSVIAERFVGVIQQRPPAFSAIKLGGRRAYDLARAGRAPEIAARPVIVHSIDVIEYRFPRLVLTVRCGKGTYIRSLARDIGLALGVGGMLSGLRRTAVGPYTIEAAAAPEALPSPLLPEHLLAAPAGEGNGGPTAPSSGTSASAGDATPAGS
ncbi:MAG: tRNA pseudouridine(55) synthase TruB [Phycisphaerales bacterium]|nr:tRNA pseudouridine(55) synthase TruB [Phycisphaerales bacterium]